MVVCHEFILIIVFRHDDPNQLLVHLLQRGPTLNIIGVKYLLVGIIEYVYILYIPVHICLLYCVQ